MSCYEELHNSQLPCCLTGYNSLNSSCAAASLSFGTCLGNIFTARVCQCSSTSLPRRRRGRWNGMAKLADAQKSFDQFKARVRRGADWQPPSSSCATDPTLGSAGGGAAGRSACSKALVNHAEGAPGAAEASAVAERFLPTTLSREPRGAQLKLTELAAPPPVYQHTPTAQQELLLARAPACCCGLAWKRPFKIVAAQSSRL